ncbi:unnamed protein product [Closterium sp. Yama58-4]|nr:unnamed protein product [Closterium sp. Yama58-4]
MDKHNKLTFLELNINGLGSNGKQERCTKWIRKATDVVVLTDTRIPADHNFCTQVRSEAQAVVSPSQRAGGVAVLGFLKGMRFTDVVTQESGRLNLGPSQHTMLLGADPELDKTSKLGTTAENLRLLQICSRWDLQDAFRSLHPTRKEFTFFSRSARTSTRIDIILISHSLLGSVVDARQKMVPYGLTDHSFTAAVTVKSATSEENGPGLWRLQAPQANGEGTRWLVSAVMSKQSEQQAQGLTRLIANLRACMRAHVAEERKRVRATIRHLERKVENLRWRVMAEPLAQDVYEELVKNEVALKLYQDSNRERLQIMSGLMLELAGESPSGFLSGLVTSRKAKTEIHELILNGKSCKGAREFKLFERSAVLSKAFTTAVTILLHKKGDRAVLSNYRPITLLSFFYKLLAKVLANRIKKVLPRVISPNQFGFLTRRSLKDAISLVADVIDAAAEEDEDWLLLLVDFQKAYDSVSREYLFKTLGDMGFSAEFTAWVKGFHDGAATKLLLNGWLGERVEMQKGVRQGCPLAPYLFRCAVEPLCQEVERRGLGIKKRGIGAMEYVGYADDTTLVLKGKEQVLQAKSLLDDFASISGLKVNQEKTTLMPLGKNRRRLQPDDSPFSWAANGVAERLLGVWITSGGSPEPAWDNEFERVSAVLSCWSSKHLKTSARVTIINCYAVPILLFQAQIYTPPQDIWKKVKRLCHSFITHRVNSTVIQNLGKAVAEQDPLRNWLWEKAVGFPLGLATVYVHPSILKHWLKGGFSIFFRGKSPFGGQKGSLCLKDVKLGDLLKRGADGSRELKDDATLERELGGEDQRKRATKAWGAVPKKWRDMVLKKLAAEEVFMATSLVRTASYWPGEVLYYSLKNAMDGVLYGRRVEVDKKGYISRVQYADMRVVDA